MSKSENIKVIKVDHNLKSGEAKLWIQEGKYCLEAAVHLFKSSPFFMFPAATLCHHGIELLLKACSIWDKCEYYKSHELLYIANQVGFLELTEEYKNLLTKIDTFFFFRYPMNEDDYSRIEETLIDINDKIGPDIQVKPGEIGTDDLEKVLKFHCFLIESMPDDLYSLYTEISSTIKPE